MTPDYYKVNVITYLNPHQIWILSHGKEDFLFEQIGLYGILPLEKTLDIDYSSFINVKCEDWKPAAAAVMRCLLEECEEVWFWPTCFSSKTSMFDDNIHTYGEIKIKLKNGKVKKLSKELIKSDFAYGNVCEFHEKLRCGKIKSKLDNIKALEILKDLENHCSSEKMRKCLEMQTSVLRAYQMLELYITDSTIIKHNNEEVKRILNDKSIDFDLCKGLNEVSLGRACRRSRPILHVEESEVITKGLNQMDKSDINCSIINSDGTNINLSEESQSETVVCSEINQSVGKQNQENWLSRKMKLLHILESKSEIIVEKVEENCKMKIENPLKDSKTIEIVTDDDFYIEQNSIKNMINKINDFNCRSIPNQAEQETKSRNDLLEPKHKHGFVDKTNSIYQFQSKMSSIQEENIKPPKTSHAKQTRLKNDGRPKIAFGPPEMDRRRFKIQHITVPKVEDIQKTDIGNAALPKKDNLYDDIDSEVGTDSICSGNVNMANEVKENSLMRKLKFFKRLEQAKKDLECV